MPVKISSAVKAALTAAVLAPLVVVAATPPSATLYGGGATLPQIAYTGTSWLSANGTTVNNPILRLTDPTDLGSLFGEFTATVPPTSYGETAFPAVSYCAIGSGGGRKVFYGLSGFVASQACGDYTTSSKNGFSAPGAEPNFAASDAPLAITEYDAFVTNKGATHNEPVQIPSVAGAIAMAYANSDVTTQINLTESQICQIFKGSINNWNQISPSYPTKAIKLVYRSDDSGTSFNFSNHLSAVCPTAIPTAVSGFSTQSTFVNTYPSAIPPAGSIGANGNGAVVTAIQGNDGSIGYAEVEDAVDRSVLAGSKILYSTVSIQPDVAAVKKGPPGVTYKKWDPTSLANKFTIPAGGVLTDSVINGNDANGRPIVSTISSVTTTHAPSQSGCVYLANPASIATAAVKTYTKTNSVGSTTYNEYASYPIVAVTYLLAYNTGNGADANNLKSLISFPYAGNGSNNYNNVTTVGDNAATSNKGTGYAYVAGVPSGFGSTIKNCIKP